MKQRGEISSTQLVTIILALVGFTVLLLLLWAAFGDFNSLGDREACRLSVLTRATAPTAAQSGIPLQCTTQKICLTNERHEESSYQFAGQH